MPAAICPSRLRSAACGAIISRRSSAPSPSGLSAGLTAGINLSTSDFDTSKLSQNLIAGFGNRNLTIAGLLEAGLDGVISNGLSAAVYGTDFGSGVLASVVSYIADGVAGSGIREISDITGHGGFSITKLVAKATLNCLAAEAKGASCASGAVGSLVTELLVAGGATLGTDPLNIPKYRARLELAAAIAGYFVSEGKGENVFASANAALIDYDNNAVPLVIWGIIALGGYVTYQGDGNPVEGLRVIARGEDIVNVLAAAGTEAAIGFSSEHFPHETEAVLGAITAAGEAANVAITYLDKATGKTVSSNWAKLPLSTREAIIGGSIVASIVIPSGAAPKILSKFPVASKKDRVIDVSGAPKGRPRVTIKDQYAHHNEMRTDVIDQLKGQGYKVADGEASFGNTCGVGRCRPDILYEAPDGTKGIIEIKTGNADLSIRQTEIFPQIRDGNAIPRGNVAARFGLRPGVRLKDQGYPNGIPIEVREFPGAGQ